TSRPIDFFTLATDFLDRFVAAQKENPCVHTPGSPRRVSSVISWYASVCSSSVRIGSNSSLYGPVPVLAYMKETDSCRSCATIGCQSRKIFMTFCVSLCDSTMASRLLSWAVYFPQY